MYSVRSTRMAKKEDQIGVRIRPELKLRWEAFVKEEFKQAPSVLAGQVLEEFMACFISDDDLNSVGLAQLAVTKPGPLISLAIKRSSAKPKNEGEPGASQGTTRERKKRTGS